jgi:hypothetical protein
MHALWKREPATRRAKILLCTVTPVNLCENGDHIVMYMPIGGHNMGRLKIKWITAKIAHHAPGLDD